LESSLCVEELLKTIKAIHERENRNNRFQAAIQGVELEDSSSKATEYNEEDDITSLKGWRASKAGFGIGVGLGHVVMEG
jgi:hypothetical protein